LPQTEAELAGRPEADNLVGIFAALEDTSKSAVLRAYGGEGFGQRFKRDLAELLAQRLGPVSAEMERLIADPGEIDRVLAAGAERARALAQPVLEETKRLVGFWKPSR
jgi:tryptophanyl-tRNA synthetase